MGLVAHWKNLKSAKERNLEEFSWACQYNQALFSRLSQLGCDLENVVYYQVVIIIIIPVLILSIIDSAFILNVFIVFNKP